AGPEVAAGMGTTVGYVDEAVRAALAIVGVVAISRAGAVRRPWHLAPLWTLVAFVAPQLVLAVLAASPATVDTAISVAPLGSVVYIAAPLFLGVLAIVLGVTPPRRGASAEPVFSGRADDPA
ncbi:MAG: hypothetical protein J0I62_20515, partial [Microbacterium sp.]|nr:hypothetical protein [Microbacterium sp.]